MRVDDEANPSPAIAYRAKCPDFVLEPSEHYLVAIHVHLRAHWNMDGETIPVLGWDKDAGVIRVLREWRRESNHQSFRLVSDHRSSRRETPTTSDPGKCRQLSLESLCVEINARRSVPWKMPATISQVVGKLVDIGIGSCQSLASCLEEEEGGGGEGLYLNRKLAAKGHSIFGEETLRIMRELLLVGL